MTRYQIVQRQGLLPSKRKDHASMGAAGAGALYGHARRGPDAAVGRGTANRSVGSDSARTAVKKHHKELTPWVRDPG